MFQENNLYTDDLKYICALDLPWQALHNKTVLISGATGMLGKVLIDALMFRNAAYGSNISVTALGRNQSSARERFKSVFASSHFRFISHDINIPLSDDAGSADFIIHGASNTHPLQYSSDPVGTIATNVFGTHNLLEYALKCDAERLMFLSSVEIYGENIHYIDRFREEDLGYIDCNSLRGGYPESKRLGETLLNAYMEKYGLDMVIARLSRSYGPTMLPTDSKASSQFIKNAVNAEDIVLKSEGKQLFSYCHATDSVSAMLTILLKGARGAAYNVADEQSDVTLAELAKLAASIAGTSVVFDLPNATEQKGFSKATKALLDASKLKSIGWSPKYDMKTGLQNTISILKNGLNNEAIIE